VAAVAVTVVLVISLRFGHRVEAFLHSPSEEVFLLKVFGTTLLVAGAAQSLQVSAAVGAFLVGVALSGPVARTAHTLIAPLRDLFAAVFFVFFGLHTIPADLPPGLRRCWPSPAC
jgi:K+:H+ antiporter subunit KhtU